MAKKAQHTGNVRKGGGEKELWGLNRRHEMSGGGGIRKEVICAFDF